jgi:hypothetical protein
MIVDYIVTYIILTDHDEHGSSADAGLRGYAGDYITDISHDSDACSMNKYNTDVGRSTLTRRGHGYYYDIPRILVMIVEHIDIYNTHRS